MSLKHWLKGQKPEFDVESGCDRWVSAIADADDNDELKVRKTLDELRKRRYCQGNCT